MSARHAALTGQTRTANALSGADSDLQLKALTSVDPSHSDQKVAIQGVHFLGAAGAEGLVEDEAASSVLVAVAVRSVNVASAGSVLSAGSCQRTETESKRTSNPSLMFSTPKLHSSLTCHYRGAKKEDVGVNWDPEKSELAVTGVIHRPGNEEFIKTLAMDGRAVGPFEAKIRLGTRASPAQVEAEAITAKLDEGVLVVDVPKLEQDAVLVKKVEIE